MKSIGDFLAGKLRRSEVGDALRLITHGPPHPELGPLEGALESSRGRVSFHTSGLVFADGATLRYEDVVQVTLVGPVPGAEGELYLLRRDGGGVRLESSREGGEVVFATLRWIGNVILRRKLA